MLNLNFSFNSIIPWVILISLAVYVGGLSYYARHRSLPDPEFEFYSETPVRIFLHAQNDSLPVPTVRGVFNNIIEGERQLVEGVRGEDGSFWVRFQVNSPRSALLYIDNMAVEIFLSPDSLLNVHVFPGRAGDWDSLRFDGFTAGICRYYRNKANQFERAHLRAYRNIVGGDSLARMAQRLDSLAIQELGWLLLRSTPDSLPSWFLDFEKNEILYQKAYLKLSNAFDARSRYLDDLPLQNDGAVFSYYYYLYLRSWLQRHSGADNPDALLGAAASRLHGEVRDVFLTNQIFALWQEGDKTTALSEYKRYASLFSRKKYDRFLKRLLNEK